MKQQQFFALFSILYGVITQSAGFICYSLGNKDGYFVLSIISIFWVLAVIIIDMLNIK